MAIMTEHQEKVLSQNKERKEKKSFGRRLARNLSQGPFAGSILGSVLGSFKRGGNVRKTGHYKLHAGERVIKRGSRRK